jgi:hypothetical protein
LVSLYVIQGGSSRCKIGISKDPKGRIARLQIGSPTKLKLAATYTFADRETAVDVEHAVHEHLGLDWKHGEWFDVKPADVDHALVGLGLLEDPAEHEAAIARLAKRGEQDVKRVERQQAAVAERVTEANQVERGIPLDFEESYSEFTEGGTRTSYVSGGKGQMTVGWKRPDRTEPPARITIYKRDRSGGRRSWTVMVGSEEETFWRSKGFA